MSYNPLSNDQKQLYNQFSDIETGIQIRDYIVKNKLFQNCFSNYDIKLWFLANQPDINPQQLNQFISQCLQNQLIYVFPEFQAADISSQSVEFPTLFQFQSFVKTIYLNHSVKYLPSHKPPNDPADYSSKLLQSIIDVYSESVDSIQNTFKLRAMFQVFETNVAKLQLISLKDATDLQKIVFYLNIYHTLLLHASIYHGPPKSPKDDIWTKSLYDINGTAVSLEKISLALRRSFIHEGKKNDSKQNSDQKNRESVPFPPTTFDSRIVLVLCDMTRNSSPIFIFTCDNLEMRLSYATRFYVNNNVQLLINLKRVRVAPIFNLHKMNFRSAYTISESLSESEQTTETLNWILPFLAPSKRPILEALMSQNPTLDILPSQDSFQIMFLKPVPLSRTIISLKELTSQCKIFTCSDNKIFSKMKSALIQNSLLLKFDPTVITVSPSFTDNHAKPILNSIFSWKHKIRDSLALSQHLLQIVLSLVVKAKIDEVSVFPQFQYFSIQVCQLQKVYLNMFTDSDTLKAFLCNLYLTLFLHIQITNSIESSVYSVGSLQLGLNDIFHILRGNFPHKKKQHFKSTDPQVSIAKRCLLRIVKNPVQEQNPNDSSAAGALSQNATSTSTSSPNSTSLKPNPQNDPPERKLDARIHFLIGTLKESCFPSFRTFSPTDFSDDVISSSIQTFLEKYIGFDVPNLMCLVPKQLFNFKSDFCMYLDIDEESNFSDLFDLIIETFATLRIKNLLKFLKENAKSEKRQISFRFVDSEFFSSQIGSDIYLSIDYKYQKPLSSSNSSQMDQYMYHSNSSLVFQFQDYFKNLSQPKFTPLLLQPSIKVKSFYKPSSYLSSVIVTKSLSHILVESLTGNVPSYLLGPKISPEAFSTFTKNDILSLLELARYPESDIYRGSKVSELLKLFLPGFDYLRQLLSFDFLGQFMEQPLFLPSSKSFICFVTRSFPDCIDFGPHFFWMPLEDFESQLYYRYDPQLYTNILPYLKKGSDNLVIPESPQKIGDSSSSSLSNVNSSQSQLPSAKSTAMYGGIGSSKSMRMKKPLSSKKSLIYRKMSVSNFVKGSVSMNMNHDIQNRYKFISEGIKKGCWLRKILHSNFSTTDIDYLEMKPGLYVGFLRIVASAKSISILVPEKSHAVIPMEFTGCLDSNPPGLVTFNENLFQHGSDWINQQMNSYIEDETPEETLSESIQLQNQIIAAAVRLKSKFQINSIGSFCDLTIVNLDENDKYSVLLFGSLSIQKSPEDDLYNDCSFQDLDLFTHHNSLLFSPLTYSVIKRSLAPFAQKRKLTPLQKYSRYLIYPIRWTVFFILWLNSGCPTIKSIVAQMVQRLLKNRQLHSSDVRLEHLVNDDSHRSFSSANLVWNKVSSYMVGYRDILLEVMEQQLGDALLQQPPDFSLLTPEFVEKTWDLMIQSCKKHEKASGESVVKWNIFLNQALKPLK